MKKIATEKISSDAAENCDVIHNISSFDEAFLFPERELQFLEKPGFILLYYRGERSSVEITFDQFFILAILNYLQQC